MSAPVNGGHGRRIVEDKVEFRKSQVPVSKALVPVKAASVKPVKVPGSSKAEFLARQKHKDKVNTNVKRGLAATAGVGLTGTAYSLGHKNEAKGKYSLDPQRSEEYERMRVGKADRDGKARFARNMGIGIAGGAVTGAALARVLRKPVSNLALARKARKAAVGKSQRYYDPEHRRQRRLGLAEAALLGAGGVATGVGVRGGLKATKSARELARAATAGDADKKVLAVGRKHAGLVAGGTTVISGAAGVNYHGNHSRGRGWR